ncbi:MAG: neutral zinc metallopeptidase [Synechococcaceae cyanobacterium]|jgi:predicted metalloprotease|nr:neutral zinc metallopeptidase [Synechococcaceae cyanobacterium]
MRWEQGRRSDNVEDRRGMGAPAMVGGGVGLVGVILAVVVALMGGDPMIVLEQMGGSGALGPGPVVVSQPRAPSPEQDRLADFVSVVLADTEDTWSQEFRQQGARYTPPKLVIFDGTVSSACGLAQAAMGPFYCPNDQKVYVDLAFYRQLRQQLGAPGDFAQAYVIAHEVGHHVQHLLGIDQQVQRAQRRLPQREANQLSVRLELQADCLAGVWAHHTGTQRATLEPGDIEEALNAASRIGDDTLQRQSSGRVRPDSFTHGSSAQRQQWFARGLRSGSMDACDTFQARI